MKIDLKVLAKLPPEHIIIGDEWVEDMDRKRRHTLIVSWYDSRCGGRCANFCIDTGDYIGDTLMPFKRADVLDPDWLT